MSTIDFAKDQVIARARDMLSAAGRTMFHEDHALIPDAEFVALVEALDDLEGLEKLEEEDEYSRRSDQYEHSEE